MDLAEPEGLGLTAQVVAILEATIGLDNVEMTDTFAELGIDSLGWLRLYRGLKSCPLVKSVRSELLADGETTVHTLIAALGQDDGDAKECADGMSLHLNIRLQGGDDRTKQFEVSNPMFDSANVSDEQHRLQLSERSRTMRKLCKAKFWMLARKQQPQY